MQLHHRETYLHPGKEPHRTGSATTTTPTTVKPASSAPSKRNKRRTKKAHECHKVLTRKQLENSVILDFESLKDGDPMLSATLSGAAFEQTVLNPHLKLAGDHKGLPFKALSHYCHDLLDQCEKHDGMIIAYSTKELTDLERITGRRVSHRYINALTIAKKWRKRFLPDEHRQVRSFRRNVRQRRHYLGGRGNQLFDFTRLMNITPPSDYGKGCEAARLRHVTGQLSRLGDYTKLSRVAKAKWTKALKHNEFDVRALGLLCQRIVSDFGW